MKVPGKTKYKQLKITKTNDWIDGYYYMKLNKKTTFETEGN